MDVFDLRMPDTGLNTPLKRKKPANTQKVMNFKGWNYGPYTHLDYRIKQLESRLFNRSTLEDNIGSDLLAELQELEGSMQKRFSKNSSGNSAMAVVNDSIVVLNDDQR